MTSVRDTIFALATAPGRAALAVIRISGPATRFVIETMSGAVPAPRRAALRAIRSGTGEILDRGLVLWFPGPRSYTGEDSAEFQIHGGRAVASVVLDALGSFPGCRFATPGEFARRALEAGRVDLVAVEGLADLIDSETEGQRRQALRQMEGLLSRTASDWKRRLIALMARVEADLDFSDEGDVPEGLPAGFRTELEALEKEFRSAVADRRGEKLRDGVAVVIAGPPNAGKSTLLNVLARREAAIVSPYAGTTRDPVEVRLDFQGVPLLLIDTAGIRQTDDPVEMIGIERTLQRAGTADVGLWLLSADAADEEPPIGPEWIRVRTKKDLGVADDAGGLAVSAVTGEGMDGLVRQLGAIVSEKAGSGDSLIARGRQREALTRALAAMERARAEAVQVEPAVELLAEELRLAARALDALVGRVGVDDVLDRLFSDFCIGK
jgi:tRNA modification GTPase